MKHVLRALLLVSLLANVALVLSRHETTPTPTVHRDAVKPAGPMPNFPIEEASAARRDYASIDRATLEQRLVIAEAKVADRAPIADKFAESTRSVETETRVKPYLDEVFAKYQVAEPKYRCECRGRVCKVDSDVEDEWRMPLQKTFPTRDIFREMSFSPAGTFIELAPGADIPAAFLSGMITAAYVRARKPCAFAQAPVGDISFTLAYDAATRTFAREVHGSLASQPIAGCISKALDEVIASTTLPPEMTSSARSWPTPLSMPIDDDE